MNEGSDTGRFEPLHDAHAIEQLAIGVAFDAAVSEQGMRSAAAGIQTSYGTDLPGSANLQTVTLSFGLSVSASPSPASATVGRAFTHTLPNGAVDRELRLEPAAISFRTTAYTRWASIWGEAEKYFQTVLPFYLQNATIAAFTMHFVDQFRWVGETSRCRVDRLLRPGSPYVCPYVYGTEDLWHSYTGCFIRASDRVKRLLNLNVDFLEQNQVDGPGRVVQITTLITDRTNQPGYQPLGRLAPADALNFVASNANDMHAYCKQVFGQVINDQMARRIALIE